MKQKVKVIVKNVQGFYDGVRQFIVIPVTDGVRKELNKFCKVPDTDELLFSMSKYASVRVSDGLDTDGLDTDELSGRVGSATMSVKLETAEYDWTYKSKKGHTKKWQVCGILFKSPIDDSNLEGLEDD